MELDTKNNERYKNGQSYPPSACLHGKKIHMKKTPKTLNSLKMWQKHTFLLVTSIIMGNYM